MPQDPRVEHLQRLHRQRQVRAAGQSHAQGRLLLALVLLSIILGAVLTLPAHGAVRAWVHQVSASLQVDRVGVLPPPDGRSLRRLLSLAAGVSWQQSGAMLRRRPPLGSHS
jgi:hypothetical protein